MPLYYFNIHADGHRYDDPKGLECKDGDAALCEAKIAARELSADRLRRGIATPDTVFEIRDAAGTIIGTIPFPRMVE